MEQHGDLAMARENGAIPCTVAAEAGNLAANFYCRCRQENREYLLSCISRREITTVASTLSRLRPGSLNRQRPQKTLQAQNDWTFAAPSNDLRVHWGVVNKGGKQPNSFRKKIGIVSK